MQKKHYEIGVGRGGKKPPTTCYGNLEGKMMFQRSGSDNLDLYFTVWVSLDQTVKSS